MSDLDASIATAFAYARQWLADHLGVAIWIIPAGPSIRVVRGMALMGSFLMACT